MVLDQDDYSDPEFRQLMIDALVGIGTGNYDTSIALANEGLARFSGHQHNEHWDWNIGVLGELEFNTLKNLYDGLCKLRSKRETLPTPGAGQ